MYVFSCMLPYLIAMIVVMLWVCGCLTVFVSSRYTYMHVTYSRTFTAHVHTYTLTGRVLVFSPVHIVRSTYPRGFSVTSRSWIGHQSPSSYRILIVVRTLQPASSQSSSQPILTTRILTAIRTSHPHSPSAQHIITPIRAAHHHTHPHSDPLKNLLASNSVW